MEDQEGRDFFLHALGGDHHLPDIGSGGNLEEEISHESFDDGPESSGPRSPIQGFGGDGSDGRRFEGQAHTLEFEHLFVLFDQSVLRLLKDTNQGILVQFIKGHGNGQSSHQLRNQTIPLQVFRFDQIQDVIPGSLQRLSR